jgi:hypothetical protein
MVVNNNKLQVTTIFYILEFFKKSLVSFLLKSQIEIVFKKTFQKN